VRAMVEAQPKHTMETLEQAIASCPDFNECGNIRGISVQLSEIRAKDSRRGSYDAKILIVTESPDQKSSKGRAYSGSTGTRIMNMFLKDEYAVCLDYDLRSPRYIWRFLIENKIYRTSAVKCALNGSDGSVAAPPRIVERCRKRFLDGQIRNLRDLELIIPMGRLAIASVLHRPPGNISLQKILGKEGKGILAKDGVYGKRLVALPHPSGTNLLFNPPELKVGDTSAIARQKWQFYQALSTLRNLLIDMGYRLRRRSQRIENSFKGYFS